MRVLLPLVLALVSAAGCKRDAAPPAASEAPPAERIEVPWPPPGAEKAPPPPEVTALFELLVNAFNARNGTAVSRLYVSEQAFRAVSECDDPNTVRDVLSGRDESAERASASAEPVQFKGVSEGYLLAVPAGGKPGPCRARRPVSLYLARYDWEVGGRVERREAHFMKIGDVWFVAKL